MKKTGLMAKRIPTVVGVLILLGGLITGVFLVNSRQSLVTKAGPTEAPKNVKISGKGSAGFTVSWTTDTPVTGFLNFSENPAKITTPAGDIRDQISGSSQGYTNHFVSVTGLNFETTYYFLIGSGSQMYDDTGKPFEVRTGKQVIAPPEDMINGKIVSADGGPVNNAIVYVEVEGGETLSTMTKTDGVWKLNLALSRDKSGAVLGYDPTESLISIFVQAGISGTATAITSTGNAKPVPDIVLGKNQSFVETVISTESETSEGAIRSEGFKNITEEAAVVLSPEATESAGSIIIMNPAINGEMIATSSPEFLGKAPPGTKIRISVHSPIELTQEITTDENGEWKWTPPEDLDPGVHTLTLEYTDENNVFQKIVRTFTVLAADQTEGLPAFTATPSGEIVTPSATPTATPSGEIATPSATPTAVVSMPATNSGTLEDTGGVNTTVLIAALGVVLYFVGRRSKKWWVID